METKNNNWIESYYPSIVKELDNHKHLLNDYNVKIGHHQDLHLQPFDGCEECSYKSNARLKDNISRHLNGMITNDESINIYKWIVNVWGGIRRYKVAENIQLINDFLNGKERDDYYRISSLSKIASFRYPEKYFIYDSRVAISLNYLLLKVNSPYYFYMPSSRGRNSETIAKITNKLLKENIMPIYDSYVCYCKLVKDIYSKVFTEKDTRPDYLEMLLFMMAYNRRKGKGYVAYDIDQLLSQSIIKKE